MALAFVAQLASLVVTKRESVGFRDRHVAVSLTFVDPSDCAGVGGGALWPISPHWSFPTHGLDPGLKNSD